MTPDNALTWGDLSPLGKKIFAGIGIAVFGGAVIVSKIIPDDKVTAATQEQVQQQLTADALAGKSGSLVCSVDTIPGVQAPDYGPLHVTISATEIAATDPKGVLRVYLTAMTASHDCHGIPGP